MLFRSLRNLTEFALFLPFNWLAKALPFHAAGVFGSFLGGLTYHVIGYRRRVSLDNLGHAFPDRTPAELREIAGRAYRGYGRSLIEMLWAGGASESEAKKTTRLLNPEIPLAALARGKGVIFLSGHFGSWELSLASMQLLLGVHFVAIAQSQRNRYIDAVLTANRRRFGGSTVTMRQSIREAVTVLRGGGSILLLGDQSGAREAVYVDFFGRPAATHRGTAAFSLKCDSPIVMFFFIRQDDGTYAVAFEEVDRNGLSGTHEEKIVELTRRHAMVLERYIRSYPDHWLWMHKRWKHTEFYLSQHAALRRESVLREHIP
jgi:KDO2-lipid IV(A) lauroyltransferase